MKKTISFVALLLVASWVVVLPKRSEAATVRKIIFPVIGATNYSNDYGAPRTGHTHIGNDIFGVKGQILIAAVDGTVRQVAYPEPSYGWYISLTDADGYEYVYIHINNDTPGTDDGNGGPNNAYMFGTGSGWPVRAGQAIAYMGDSGNAETTKPHLHFEIHNPDGSPINPYFSLQAAKKISTPKSRARRDGEVIPFPGTTTGLRLAAGQLDPTTPDEELVVAQSAGAAPRVRIFSGPVHRIREFSVNDVKAKGGGGVDVAVGDTNGDGTDEILLGYGRGNEPYVQVRTMAGDVLSSFLAYPIRFRGGIHIAAADLDGDGRDEIITGAGPGGGPNVRVFSFTGELLSSFDAYEGTFHGGVDVAGLDASDTSLGSIVTTPGSGRTTEVRVFDQGGVQSSAWNGYTSATITGARVTVMPGSDFTADSIIIVPAGKSTALVRRFGFDGNLWDEERAFERWWFGDFDVGMWNGQAIAGTGQKRSTSVVPVSLNGSAWRWDLNF